MIHLTLWPWKCYSLFAKNVVDINCSRSQNTYSFTNYIKKYQQQEILNNIIRIIMKYTFSIILFDNVDVDCFYKVGKTLWSFDFN
jgi:hypothetical protein